MNMTAPLASSPPHRSLDLSTARQARDALARLLATERTAMAGFLVALSEFDRSRGWQPLGHATLFAFLRAELGLSSGAAFWRMSAARLLQRFPDLVEPLRDGRLCLSTTAELAKVLTEENRAEVLPRYFGLSAREAKEVTAELLPRESPPLRAVVTGLVRPVPVQPVPPPLDLSVAITWPEPPGASPEPLAFRTSETGSARPARVEPRDDVEPITADLRRLHVTVSRRFLKKVHAAREGLSHALPGATTEQVLEAALDLLLERQARARGKVKKPRTDVAAPTSTPTLTPTPTEPPPPRRSGPRESIPTAVRRAVWARDGGRCSWPLDAGGTCNSTHRLELDHIHPWARDGQPTEANLRLTCHAHNTLAARLAFGDRCVDRYAGARRGA
jgi:hypothetical protein